MKTRCWKFAAALTLGAMGVLFTPSQNGATTLMRLSLAQMARLADTVVRARCDGTESRWDQGNIWTFSTFDVLETLKGSPARHLTVRLPGGRVGHLQANVEGAPRFRPGEEGFLFLEKTSGGEYAVTAWAEGTFRIRADGGSGEANVTQDSAAMPLFDAATHRFATEGARNVGMGEFRRKLSAALNEAAPK